MYYQSLITIEDCLSKSSKIEKRMIAKYVHQLDEWLITRSKLYKHRLNPLQFSLDNDITDEISLYLFELGLEKGLFDVYYEAETELKEPLGLISQEKFTEILTKGYANIEHPFKEEDYKVLADGVEILFALNEKPLKDFVIASEPTKKVIAPACTTNRVDNSLRHALLNRRTGG